MNVLCAHSSYNSECRKSSREDRRAVLLHLAIVSWADSRFGGEAEPPKRRGRRNLQANVMQEQKVIHSVLAITLVGSSCQTFKTTRLKKGYVPHLSW